MSVGYQRDVVDWISNNGGKAVGGAAVATATLDPDDFFVDATIPTSASLTLTLPPLPERPGARILIRCTEDLGGTSVIVAAVTGWGAADADMSAQTLTAVGGFVLIENVHGLFYRAVMLDAA